MCNFPLKKLILILRPHNSILRSRNQAFESTQLRVTIMLLFHYNISQRRRPIEFKFSLVCYFVRRLVSTVTISVQWFKLNWVYILNILNNMNYVSRVEGV